MRRILFCALCLGVSAAPLRADDPIPVKTLNELKGATVFVRVAAGPLSGSGSGFLVKVEGETGYLVTNHHVIEPPRPGLPTAVTAVFWSGTRKEQSAPAVVLAADALYDLAVLKVTGVKDLPAPIDLSQKVELIETMPVFMLGFPFGRALSTTKGNPAITIGKGTVSSIRTNDNDEVAFVQLDGDLNPGNSGGPVVDGKGRLVGIAVAKLRGTRIGMAIPPLELSRMLQGRISQISTKPRRVAEGAAEIDLQVGLIDPLNKQRTIQAYYVRADSLKEKPAPGKKGVWSVLPGASRVAIEVKAQRATTTLKLTSTEKKTVQFLVQLAYTRESETIVTAPKPVDVDFGAPVVITPGGPRDPVVITPAELGGDKVVKALPSAIADVVVGGGGRFLILHLPRDRKLAVFDVSQAKVVKYLPLASDDVKLAAGMNKLVVVLSDKKLIQRWDLLKLEREATKPLPFKEGVRAACMGSASAGPLLLFENNGDERPATAQFFDLNTLKPADIPWDGGKAPATLAVFLNASADGRLFAMRDGVGSEPHSLTTILLEGNRAKVHVGGMPGSMLLPSPDSKQIYSESGIYSPELKLLYPKEPIQVIINPFMPSHHADYYMRLEGSGPDKGKLMLYLRGYDRAFAVVTDVEGYIGEPIAYGKAPDKLMHAKRVHFIPDAKVLVTIPQSDDRLVLRRLDPDKALEKSDLDYLLVVSRPPAVAKKGTKFTYQLAVKSKKGGVKYKVENGPDGMKVSAGGLIEWQVPAKGGEAENTIIIGITNDAGQECLHTFTLTVE